MRKLMIVVAVAVWMTGPSFAAERSANSDVVDVINRLMDAFNKGDTNTVFALCTDEMSILDEFPPHEWHGPAAFSKWFADYDADCKKNGVTDGIVTLGKARHVEVAGDRAYVVAPAHYRYKQNGRPKKENGIDTVTLHKTKDGWRITGWCWTKQ